MGRLTEYINSKRGKPFVWGKNDCLSFVNGAVRAMTGEWLCGERLRGYSTERGALLRYERFRRKTGHADIVAAMDDKFDRLLTLHPPHGAVVARPLDGGAVLGYSFGVIFGSRPVFVGPNGMEQTMPDVNDIYWMVT